MLFDAQHVGARYSNLGINDQGGGGGRHANRSLQSLFRGDSEYQIESNKAHVDESLRGLLV